MQILLAWRISDFVRYLIGSYPNGIQYGVEVLIAAPIYPLLSLMQSTVFKGLSSGLEGRYREVPFGILNNKE